MAAGLISRNMWHGRRLLCHQAAAVKPFEEIPGPPGGRLPFFGHGPLLVKKPHGSQNFWKNVADLRAKYAREDLLRIRIPILNWEGDGRILMIFRPDDIAEVFRNEGKYPYRGKSMFQTFRVIRERSSDLFYESTGLLTEDGEAWHWLRSKIQQDLMKPSSALYFVPKLQRVADNLVQHIRQGRTPSTNLVPDFCVLANLYSFDAIMLITLNEHVGTLLSDQRDPEVEQFIRRSRQLLFNVPKLMQSVPIWKWLPPRISPTFRAVEDDFLATARFIQSRVEAVRKQLKSRPAGSPDVGGDDDDKLSLLEKLILHNEPESTVPMLTAVDSIAGGVDTVAFTLSYVVYHLATNPDKQERLRQEILEILGQGELRKEHVTQMKYFRACLKESYRLTPSVPGGARSLHQDFILRGYRIPAKTFIMWNHIISGRDELNFTQPEEFLPERWLERKSINPFAVQQFSYGPRMCPGKRLAEMEMQLAVVKLLQNFRIQWAGDDGPLATRSELLHIPAHPLPFTFHDL